MQIIRQRFTPRLGDAGNRNHENSRLQVNSEYRQDAEATSNDLLKPRDPWLISTVDCNRVSKSVTEYQSFWLIRPSKGWTARGLPVPSVTIIARKTETSLPICEIAFPNIKEAVYINRHDTVVVLNITYHLENTAKNRAAIGHSHRSTADP